jgi:hypothetical protein
MPEMVLSPSFHSLAEVCFGMPYRTVQNINFSFSSTCCLKILLDGAFPIKTPYLSLQRSARFANSFQGALPLGYWVFYVVDHPCHKIIILQSESWIYEEFTSCLVKSS